MTASTDLDPAATPSNIPTRFDHLLKYVMRRRPALRCYILTWDHSPVFALERDPFSRIRFSWAMPRGVRFAFDDRCPMGGSHHQKVVVVDDQLAFCGGIDLTVHRWDTSEHRPDEPLRKTPMGKVYGPYHEVQAMVDGPVATSLGALARDRWNLVGADDIPPVSPAPNDYWPQDVAPDFTEVDVAISRTMPCLEDQPAVRECEALFLDSIARATRTIYIENQYFTNTKLTDALVARLAERDGPEVVIAVPRDSHGWLEQQTVGALRDQLFRRLLASDPHKRLRLLAPVASRSRDLATFVHSKVMTVDDELVRIGSANCTHRSMGVDTECDVAVEARGNATIRSGIRQILHRLIAEHLALPTNDVADQIERAGSLRAVLDRYQNADHTLARIELPVEPIDPPSDAVRMAVDPDEPIVLDTDAGPEPRRRSARSARAPGLAVLVRAVWALMARPFTRPQPSRRTGAEFG
jgi:phosphatidylserine/phosphatidylglycerophosphate/cardiolipin synthase-like enzyme